MFSADIGGYTLVFCLARTATVLSFSWMTSGGPFVKEASLCFCCSFAKYYLRMKTYDPGPISSRHFLIYSSTFLLWRSCPFLISSPPIYIGAFSHALHFWIWREGSGCSSTRHGIAWIEICVGVFLNTSWNGAKFVDVCGWVLYA